jgi:predicted DNA-binding protein (MmcQ/YjbR family)
MSIGLQEIIDHCMQKSGAEIAFPFGDIPICFKYNGRIFIEIYPNDDNYKITVRCEPVQGEYYRIAYPSNVIPGYHVPLRQRKYKNTVILNNGIDKEKVFEMIDHSYSTLQ